MRFLFGYLGSSLIAAIVAATWVALTGDDQTILRSFGVPDFLGQISPALAVAFRHVLEFQATQDAALVAILDTLAALPLFLVFDLPAMVLFSAMNGSWKGESTWDRARPLWGALIFAALAVVIVLGSRKYGLPPMARLKVDFPGVALAAATAGALIGLGRLIEDAFDRHR